MRTLAEQHRLPLTAESLPAALGVLDAAVTQVAGEYRERMVPAIDRVWNEEMAGIARDLRGWLRHVAADDAWEPRYFELSFGLPHDPDRDLRSVPDPVLVDGRFPLRGAIDAIDVHRQTGVLRVTDHKTGKDRTKETLVIFCTSAGGFKQRPVLLDPAAKRLAIEALDTIDRAVEHGTLAPAPAEGACRWCEFRPVCGPGVEHRLERKLQTHLADLVWLRSRP